MLLLLIDENFNHRILRGLRLRVPALDVVIVQETAMQGLQDPLLCAKAYHKPGRSEPGHVRACLHPNR